MPKTRNIMIATSTLTLALSLAACEQAPQTTNAPTETTSTSTTQTTSANDTSSPVEKSPTANETTATGHAPDVMVEPYHEGYETGVHHVRITVKDYGTMEAELNADVAPVTVSNFCHLANEGTYNGLTFHRIIDGFVIQGGDPLGNGLGGTKPEILGEFAMNNVPNDISHVRGTLSMARAVDYDSASSQFFICHEDATNLDGEYAAFGRVTSGMDVVDDIVKSTKTEDENGAVDPKNQPVIETIEVID